MIEFLASSARFMAADVDSEARSLIKDCAHSDLFGIANFLQGLEDSTPMGCDSIVGSSLSAIDILLAGNPRLILNQS